MQRSRQTPESLLHFVEDCHGIYTPYNQQDYFKAWHEKTFNNPFEGYCTGISLAYIQEKIHSKNNFMLPLATRQQTNFFNEKNKNNFIALQKSCVHYQHQYESNPEEFIDIFMRQHCGFNDNDPLRINSLNGLYNIIQDNQILLINIIYTINNNSKIQQSDHTIVIMHDSNYWRFFEPNYGEAIFKDRNNFIFWLQQETNKGALQVFTQPQQKQCGLLSISDLKARPYPYPQKQEKPFLNPLEYTNIQKSKL
jgi:hypothetical protein